MSWDSFKNLINKIYLEIIYSIYIYKKDLALNNHNGLYAINSNQSEPNQTIFWQEKTISSVPEIASVVTQVKFFSNSLGEKQTLAEHLPSPAKNCLLC